MILPVASHTSSGYSTDIPQIFPLISSLTRIQLHFPCTRQSRSLQAGPQHAGLYSRYLDGITILDCQDFTTVLLDTEGIDAVGASETMAMSLLTLTTLLSSFLIYNSKKVPQNVDLDKMRCFSQLSASLLAQCGRLMSNEAKKAFFPNFLWLLRDVHLKITDREGTELLHTRVLASESGELTDLGKSHSFPLSGVYHSPYTFHQERHHPWHSGATRQAQTSLQCSNRCSHPANLPESVSKEGCGWDSYSEWKSSGNSSWSVCGGNQQTMSSARPGSGLAGCGEAGAEGSLL